MLFHIQMDFIQLFEVKSQSCFPVHLSYFWTAGNNTVHICVCEYVQGFYMHTHTLVLVQPLLLFIGQI